MTSLVTISKPIPGVALVYLNRPSAMNALNRALRAELVEAFSQLGREDGLSAIVLTGEGKAFCAGLDLKEVGKAPELLVPDPALDPVAAVAECPVPVIAYVNGPAMTGGFELALACDLRIAGEGACFADTHGRVGALPGWGLSQRLSRIVGLGRAMEISLGGEPFGAKQALDWGLVNAIATQDEGIERAVALAEAISSGVPGMGRRLKRMIRKGYEMPLAAALHWEAAVAQEFNASIDGSAIENRRGSVIARGRTATAAKSETESKA